MIVSNCWTYLFCTDRENIWVIFPTDLVIYPMPKIILLTKWHWSRLINLIAKISHDNVWMDSHGIFKFVSRKKKRQISRVGISVSADIWRFIDITYRLICIGHQTYRYRYIGFADIGIISRYLISADTDMPNLLWMHPFSKLLCILFKYTQALFHPRCDYILKAMGGQIPVQSRMRPSHWNILVWHVV